MSSEIICNAIIKHLRADEIGESDSKEIMKPIRNGQIRELHAASVEHSKNKCSKCWSGLRRLLLCYAIIERIISGSFVKIREEFEKTKL